MKQEQINRAAIKLVGIKVRTSNKAEMNPGTGKISASMGRYFQEKLADKIMDRKNPATTLAVYTEYETDEHGDYSYFLGEEVNSFADIHPELTFLFISEARYVKFTTEYGKMPEVVIQAWQQIWKTSTQDLGGKRAYRADFELYDKRALDPSKSALDIYIGIL